MAAGYASSVGTLWAGAAIIWGVPFAAAAQWESSRSGIRRGSHA